jgi:hypothetical protein
VSDHKDVREELEDTDESRRDFINKAMAAAGGAAVAGLIASAMSGEAEAQPRGLVAPRGPDLKPGGVAPIRFASTEKTRVMEMASKDISKILAAENMIPGDKADQLASVTLSISWD